MAGFTHTPEMSGLGVMPERPTDDEIVDHLADHFDNHGMNVIEWLATMDLQAQRARFGQPALFEGAQS